MCGLTLAWVASENSTSNWNADILTQSSSLDPIFSATVSGVDHICPWFHANSSADSPLCCPVANFLPAPLSSQLSFVSPYHFRIRRDFRSQNPLPGFLPKQTNRPEIARKQNWKEKQLYGRFKRLISNILHEKTRTWLRKRKLKRKTESLLIIAQNNTIRTNHIKARIDKTKRNSKCRLCGDKDETIKQISECSKLAQKENKTRHDWVGKVIN